VPVYSRVQVVVAAQRIVVLANDPGAFVGLLVVPANGAAAASCRAVSGVAYDGRAVGEPLSRAGRGGYGRSPVEATPQSTPDPDPYGAAHHQGPIATSVGTGTDRLPAGAASLDGPLLVDDTTCQPQARADVRTCKPSICGPRIHRVRRARPCKCPI
jgi:hypothetical protein